MQFFVSWDQRLLPTIHVPPSCAYAEQEHAKQVTQHVTVDLAAQLDFFENFVMNDKLAKISTSHLVRADASSASCDECLELARLHSLAVDFVKTGIPAQVDDALLVENLPDFKTQRAAAPQSPGIVGQLYRAACKEFEDAAKFAHFPKDTYHLSRFEQPGSSAFLSEACRLRDLYNVDLLLLVKEAGSDVSEAGLMAGTWAHKGGLRRGQHDDDERTKLRFRNLRSWARSEFDAVVVSARNSLGKGSVEWLAVPLQVAAAWYHSVYHPMPQKLSKDAWVDSLTAEEKLLSFAWVAHSELLLCKEGAASNDTALESALGSPVRHPVNGGTRSLTEHVQRRDELAGRIFRCNNKTQEECLRRGLVGDTALYQEVVEGRIVPGKTKIFLFNTSRSLIFGTWLATSQGGFHEKTAWRTFERISAGQNFFSAQVKIELEHKSLPIPEALYKDIVPYIPGHHRGWFGLELTAVQTEALIELGQRLERKVSRPGRTRHQGGRNEGQFRRERPRRLQALGGNRRQSRSRSRSRSRSPRPMQKGERPRSPAENHDGSMDRRRHDRHSTRRSRSSK